MKSPKMYITTEVVPAQCKDCKFFIQHYGKNAYGQHTSSGFSPMSVGHCIQKEGGKLALKSIVDSACENFRPGNEDDFVMTWTRKAGA